MIPPLDGSGAGGAVVTAPPLSVDPAARVVTAGAVVAGVADTRPAADASASRFNCAVSSSPRGWARTPPQSAPTTSWSVSPFLNVALDPWICSNAGILL